LGAVTEEPGAPSSKKLVEELLTREEFPLFITVSITGKNRKRNPARGRDGTSASSD
jgi:hypothetical protein